MDWYIGPLKCLLSVLPVHLILRRSEQSTELGVQVDFACLGSGLLSCFLLGVWLTVRFLLVWTRSRLFSQFLNKCYWQIIWWYCSSPKRLSTKVLNSVYTDVYPKDLYTSYIQSRQQTALLCKIMLSTSLWSHIPWNMHPVFGKGLCEYLSRHCNSCFVLLPRKCNCSSLPYTVANIAFKLSSSASILFKWAWSGGEGR